MSSLRVLGAYFAGAVALACSAGAAPAGGRGTGAWVRTKTGESFRIGSSFKGYQVLSAALAEHMWTGRSSGGTEGS